MAIKIGESTPIARLREAHEEVTKAGCALDVARKRLAEFKQSARRLISDENLQQRKHALEAECNRLWHDLQEKIQIRAFYEGEKSGMRHGPDQRKNRGR